MALPSKIKIPLRNIEDSILDSLSRIEKIRAKVLDKIEVMVEIVGIQKNILSIKETTKKAIEIFDKKSLIKSMREITAINSLAEDIILRIGPMEGAKFAEELAKLERSFIMIVNIIKEIHKDSS